MPLHVVKKAHPEFHVHTLCNRLHLSGKIALLILSLLHFRKADGTLSALGLVRGVISETQAPKAYRMSLKLG